MHVTPTEAALHAQGECPDDCPICAQERREDR